MRLEFPVPLACRACRAAGRLLAGRVTWAGAWSSFHLCEPEGTGSNDWVAVRFEPPEPRLGINRPRVSVVLLAGGWTLPDQGFLGPGDTECPALLCTSKAQEGGRP